MDGGRGAGDVLQVDAGEDHLVLHGVGLGDLGLAAHVHAADHLLAEVVADLDALAAGRHVDVDGEMVVDEAHLDLVLLGHARHHVRDVGAEGAKAWGQGHMA